MEHLTDLELILIVEAAENPLRFTELMEDGDRGQNLALLSTRKEFVEKARAKLGFTWD